LATLGDMKQIGLFLFFAQGGQGKYCFMSMLLTVSLTNIANVNDTLLTQNILTADALAG
jgi:hypothetical protein